MNLLVVAATKLEIEALISDNNHTEVLITGPGVFSTIYHLTKKISRANYDFIIQAGIGGTFNEQFEKTEAVIIEEDTFGDVGVYEKGNFQTLFDLGFMKANDFPFDDGWLRNKNEILAKMSLPIVKGLTVNRITDDNEQIQQLKNKFGATVESMEGAAFHFVCLQEKVNFVQLRTISNVVGERDKSKWKIKEAITLLNIELQKLIKHLG